MSEDQDIYIGKPSVNELRAYFLNPGYIVILLNHCLCLIYHLFIFVIKK